jgi:hypothetical protein
MLVLVLFAGCTEEYYETYVNDYQKNYTVNRNQWIKASDDDLGVYFYCQIKEPNLTYDVFDYGIMMAYLRYVQPTSKVTELHLLPFDDFFVDGDAQWTEQVSCAFSPGYVTFFLKYDDQTDIDPFWDSYDFQVRFLW